MAYNNENYPYLVEVVKVEKVIVLSLSAQWSDKTFFNGNPFRTVRFMRETGEKFEETIFDGKILHELVHNGDLRQGATATLRRDVSELGHGLKSINGKRWN